jgi:hypothetical protein
MGVKRGMGICVEILSPQTETYNISQLLELIKTLVRMGYC